MIKINKKTEPQSLFDYRRTNTTYDGPSFTSVKEDIRKQLLSEQGFLCAYCMTRINDNPLETKIEHWHSQSNYPHEQLNYKNLLLTCKGNEGRSPEEQHCDTKKGNLNILFNPSNPDHDIERLIEYHLDDGTIKSTNHEFDKELNAILNLNHPLLKENRLSVLKAVMEILNNKKGKRNRKQIENYLRRWQIKDTSGNLQEFCGVAIYYLKKKLSRF